MQIRQNIPVKDFHTFKTAARSRFLCEIDGFESLQQALDFAGSKQLPYYILGEGSNVLFAGNYNGLLIINRMKGVRLLSRTNDRVILQVAGGENWPRLVDHCVERGWSGIENLSLIPGTAGAAPVQNIGAYGMEIGESIRKVEAINLLNGNKVAFDKKRCEFGYRTSLFKKSSGRYFITGITLELSETFEPRLDYKPLKERFYKVPQSEITLKAVSETVKAIRREKLPDPLAIPNAGSFFKNPVVSSTQCENLKNRYPRMPVYPMAEGGCKIPAAWLIEQCGWKGKRLKSAGVHKNQPLVLVNFGNATGKEILTLAQAVRHSVSEKFGITLSFEVNIVTSEL